MRIHHILWMKILREMFESFFLLLCFYGSPSTHIYYKFKDYLFKLVSAKNQYLKNLKKILSKIQLAKILKKILTKNQKMKIML